MHARWRTWAAGVLLAVTPAVPAVSAPPQRIVSLNLCADQILVDLVAPARIAALSYLADDPRISAIADRVAGIALTRGEAEAVLGFEPDLVIAGTYSTPATLALLQRLGRRVETVPLASDIDGIRTLIRRIASVVEEPTRGEALVAAFDRRLAAVAAAIPVTAQRPTALVYQVNGLASGPESLADAVLAAAGFENLTRRTSLGSGGQIALESVLADPPDLLVLTGPVDEYRTAVAANLRHPAIAALRTDRASLVLPWRHWLCGTHHVAAAAESLSEAARALRRRPGSP